MPYIPPPALSEESQVFARVAATGSLKHSFCRVRRCRRDGHCLGRLCKMGMPQCLRGISEEEMEEIFGFLSSTAELATPECVAARLVQAKTDEEREMIEFRRWLFLHYHAEMAKAGLKSVNP